MSPGDFPAQLPCERYEVVVVDDGGDQDSRRRSTHSESGSISWRSSSPTAADAAQYGTASAVGDYAVFDDDDCRPDPQWLYAMARAIDEPGVPWAARRSSAYVERTFDRQPAPHRFSQQLFQSRRRECLVHDIKDLAFPRVWFPRIRRVRCALSLGCGRGLGGLRSLEMAWGRIVSAPMPASATITPWTRRVFSQPELRTWRRDASEIRRQRWGRVRWEGLPFYLKMLSFPFLHCLARRPAAVASLMGISD